MEIKCIKVKKNNPNLFDVETSEGEYVLHSDAIVKYGLRPGEFDDQIFVALHEDSEVIITTSVATKYIGSRLKTKKQIRDYLYGKNFSSKTVTTVIKKLEEYALVDDKIFVKSYVKSNPGFSKIKLKQKLLSFGVGKSDIEEGVEEIDDFCSCKVNAEKFLRGKILDQQTILKLTRKLQSMGYSWNTIKSVLNDLKLDVED